MNNETNIIFVNGEFDNIWRLSSGGWDKKTPSLMLVIRSPVWFLLITSEQIHIPAQPPTARLISCQDQDLAMMNSGLFHKHSPAPPAAGPLLMTPIRTDNCIPCVNYFSVLLRRAPRVPRPAHCGAAGGACKPSTADHISPGAALPFFMQI